MQQEEVALVCPLLAEVAHIPVDVVLSPGLEAVVERALVDPLLAEEAVVVPAAVDYHLRQKQVQLRVGSSLTVMLVVTQDQGLAAMV